MPSYEDYLSDYSPMELDHDSPMNINVISSEDEDLFITEFREDNSELTQEAMQWPHPNLPLKITGGSFWVPVVCAEAEEIKRARKEAEEAAERKEAEEAAKRKEAEEAAARKEAEEAAKRLAKETTPETNTTQPLTPPETSDDSNKKTTQKQTSNANKENTITFQTKSLSFNFKPASQQPIPSSRVLRSMGLNQK